MMHDEMKSDRRWLSGYDAHVPNTLEYPNITVHQLFETAVRAYPQNVFLEYEGTSFSYSSIGIFVDRVRNKLLNESIHKGDRIALIMPNIPQFVIAYYGILAAGAVVVAMNPRYKQDEFQRLFEKANIDFVFCVDSILEIVQSLKVSLKGTGIISTSPEDYKSISLETQFGDKGVSADNLLEVILVQGVDIAQNSINLNPSDAAIFQFSGGTTGDPKPAIGMHRNIVANAIQFSRWCDLAQGSENVLAAIPLYHVYGMVLALNMGVAVGAKIVLISDPTDIENILAQIQANQITFYPGVPTMYHAINKNQNAQDGVYDLTSIKACISGSFTLPPQIKEEFEKITGGKLLEGYGLSEAPTATHCNPFYGKNKTGSIGLPLPDVDARIVDIEKGEIELKPGDIGELVIKGPQVMLGYFDDTEETEHALRDGWLYTGDIARMDEEGYFYLVDRKKSLIKVNGLQVWPNEVEFVIKSHKNVKDCGVGGVPDMEHGERIICWIVMEEGETLDSEKIIDWCKKSLSSYKVPLEFFQVNELPRTGVGKILRRELINRYMKNAGL